MKIEGIHGKVAKPFLIGIFFAIAAFLPDTTRAGSGFKLPDDFCGKRSCVIKEEPRQDGGASKEQVPVSDPVGERQRQAEDLYQQGLAFLNSGNWEKAIEIFREALQKWPENVEIRSSLDRAEKGKRNQEKKENQDRLKELRGEMEKKEKDGFLKDLQRDFRAEATEQSIVQKEQDEFEKMNAQWLKRQQELIRQASAQDKRWKNEVLAAIRAIRVPSPVFTPKFIEDLHPGDILLIAPDDSWKSQAIIRGDPLLRAIDYFSGGDVSKPDFQKGQASHVMTVVKAVNGETLFLDHTSPKSRILTRKDYIREYGQRGMLVARPQAVVDGRELWAAAREAALRNPDYGFFGTDIVCSELAATVIAKATKLPLQNEHHRIGKYLGPVDITPSDFFDSTHIGKYFLISASPIFPGARRSPP